MSHKSHCFQGEYQNSCKYGEEDCPMKRPISKAILRVFALKQIAAGAAMNGSHMHPGNVQIAEAKAFLCGLNGVFPPKWEKQYEAEIAEKKAEYELYLKLKEQYEE